LLIERPAAVIFEVVRHGLHAIQPRQMIEQRIARRRHEHGVTMRRAEQLEEQRVGFAGTCRQHDAIRSNRDAAPRVVAGDRLAGTPQASGMRLIETRGGIGERCEDVVGIRDSRGRRIRKREIQQRASLRLRAAHGAGEPVGLQVAGHAR